MSLYTLLILLSCATNTESLFPYTSQQKQDTAIEHSEPEECTPEEPVASCIDGFVPIPSENPIYCIMECEAQITQTGIHSKIGEYPSSNISYYDAQEYCASINHTYTVRLPTIEEWKDVGDGVLGSGGTSYPWGDDFHAGECVLPYGDITWDSHQSCGFLHTCMSSFGVYDQIGNLWEWADSGLHIDINAWMLHQEEQGYVFTIINDVLYTDQDTLHEVHPFVVGLSPSTIDIVDGMIWIRLTESFREDLPGVGYLKSNELGLPSSHDFLPIYLSWDEQRKNAQLIVETNRDGEPIPAKVGGSFYSGADSRLDTVFWGHVPSFDGSIGFRCIYEIQ